MSKKRTSDPSWIAAWRAQHNGGWYVPMPLSPEHPLVAETWLCHVCVEPFTPEDIALIQPVSFKHPCCRDGWWAHHRECGATLIFDGDSDRIGLRPSNYATRPPERQLVIDRRLKLVAHCPACRHDVRMENWRIVLHDVDGLEPVGEGYWSGDNAEGVAHLRCRGSGRDPKRAT